MNDYNILCYARDDLLSNPHIDADIVWRAFNLAERSSDMQGLFHRYIGATTPEEKYMIERVIEDMVREY